MDLDLQFMPSIAWFGATYFRFGDLWSACGIWYQTYNKKAVDFAAAAYAISTLSTCFQSITLETFEAYVELVRILHFYCMMYLCIPGSNVGILYNVI